MHSVIFMLIREVLLQHQLSIFVSQPAALGASTETSQIGYALKTQCERSDLNDGDFILLHLGDGLGNKEKKKERTTQKGIKADLCFSRLRQYPGTTSSICLDSKYFKGTCLLAKLAWDTGRSPMLQQQCNAKSAYKPFLSAHLCTCRSLKSEGHLPHPNDTITRTWWLSSVRTRCPGFMWHTALALPTKNAINKFQRTKKRRSVW